jgi:hypothetical protein
MAIGMMGWFMLDPLADRRMDGTALAEAVRILGGV